MRDDRLPTRAPGGLGWFLRQLALVLTGVLLYFGTRGATEHADGPATEHAHDLVRLEGLLHLDVEKGAQRLLVGRSWIADAANWVYIWGHWPVIAVVMVWLALRHRTV
ncbi:MAG: phosphatase PAP2 family protein, partial [Nocardioidaceae bacterium]